jgi:hypothetical protein
MVSNLIEEGLVEEVGYGESMGGKAPILLEIVADSTGQVHWIGG